MIGSGAYAHSPLALFLSLPCAAAGTVRDIPTRTAGGASSLTSCQPAERGATGGAGVPDLPRACSEPLSLSVPPCPPCAQTHTLLRGAPSPERGERHNSLARCFLLLRRVEEEGISRRSGCSPSEHFLSTCIFFQLCRP